VTLNDLERRNGSYIYFTEFGKPAFQHITTSSCKKECSRSLSHLLMSFSLVLNLMLCSKYTTAYRLGKA